ncbi:MAG: ATP-binding protein [Mariprofundaceae bacterium]
MNANEMAQELIGQSSRQLAGLHLTRFLLPESKINQMISHVISGETVTSDSFKLGREEVPCSLHLGMDREDILALIVPDARRLEVEKHVHQHEMADAIARIALEMAHEVKNPLTSLRGAAQWLFEQTKDDETSEITQHMLGEVDRIRERIDIFLQLGPRANVSMEAVNVHIMIDDICKTSATDVQLKRIYDPSLPAFMAHGSRLRQAFENLWSNALEAGPKHIEWTTRLAVTERLVNYDGPILEVSIRNDGASIPDALREHLFEPFVTGKERGSGLGLAIVQRVIQEHGGRVTFESDILGRTVFSLLLPLTETG